MIFNYGQIHFRKLDILYSKKLVHLILALKNFLKLIMFELFAIKVSETVNEIDHWSLILPCPNVARCNQSFSRSLQSTCQVVYQVFWGLNKFWILHYYDVRESVPVLRKREKYEDKLGRLKEVFSLPGFDQSGPDDCGFRIPDCASQIVSEIRIGLEQWTELNNNYVAQSIPKLRRVAN